MEGEEAESRDTATCMEAAQKLQKAVAATNTDLEDLCEAEEVNMPAQLGGKQTLRQNILVARLAQWCGENGVAPAGEPAIAFVRSLRADMRCHYNDTFNEGAPIAEDLLYYRTMKPVPEDRIPSLQLSQYLKFAEAWVAH